LTEFRRTAVVWHNLKILDSLIYNYTCSFVGGFKYIRLLKFSENRCWSIPCQRVVRVVYNIEK
jgi:hypothetical protein